MLTAIKAVGKVKMDERRMMREAGGFQERKDSSAILLPYLGQMQHWVAQIMRSADCFQ